MDAINHEFEEGDVIIIPPNIRKKKSLNSVCVIRKINPNLNGGWVCLIGLRKNGTPSLSLQNSAYYPLGILNKVLPHTKYPKVKMCPKCKEGGKEWWHAPLEQKKGRYQCRWCKTEFPNEVFD